MATEKDLSNGRLRTSREVWCCGKPHVTPYCPWCGYHLAKLEPDAVWDLLEHVEAQASKIDAPKAQQWARWETALRHVMEEAGLEIPDGQAESASVWCRQEHTLIYCDRIAAAAIKVVAPKIAEENTVEPPVGVPVHA